MPLAVSGGIRGDGLSARQPAMGAVTLSRRQENAVMIDGGHDPDIALLIGGVPLRPKGTSRGRHPYQALAWPLALSDSAVKGAGQAETPHSSWARGRLGGPAATLTDAVAHGAWPSIWPGPGKVPWKRPGGLWAGHLLAAAVTEGALAAGAPGPRCFTNGKTNRPTRFGKRAPAQVSPTGSSARDAAELIVPLLAGKMGCPARAPPSRR